MKLSWKRIGMIVGIAALVGVLGFAGVVAAQEPSDDSTWPLNLRERVHEAVAGILGITVDEYDAALETAHDQVLEQAVEAGDLTQEQADWMLERFEGGFEARPFGRGGRGARGFRMDGWLGGLGTTPLSVAADVLGVAEDDLLDELQEGKSLAEVAEDKGVELQDIADAYLAKMTEIVNEAVAEEEITQAQADAILENAEERIATWIEGDAFGYGMFGPCGGGLRFDAPDDDEWSSGRMPFGGRRGGRGFDGGMRGFGVGVDADTEAL